jgi:hypothetical protein
VGLTTPSQKPYPCILLPLLCRKSNVKELNKLQIRWALLGRKTKYGKDWSKANITNFAVA